MRWIQQRPLSLIIAVSVSTACGAGVTPPTPAPVEAPAEPDPTGGLSPIERLVRLWFRVGPGSATLGSNLWWQRDVRREPIGPEQAAALDSLDEEVGPALEAADRALRELGLDRCFRELTIVRELPAVEPNGPRVARRNGMLRPVRAHVETRRGRAARFLYDVLRGLDDPEARCGAARVRDAGVAHALLSRIEARDGRDAVLQGEEGPRRRAELERLRELSGEIVDCTDHACRAALRDEAVSIYRRWNPEDPHVVALRALEITENTSILEILEAVARPRQSVQRFVMPPRSGLSEESRRMRRYLEALFMGAAEALRVLEEGPIVVPEGVYAPDPVRPDQLAAACGLEVPPNAAAPDEDVIGHEADPEEEWNFDPVSYACSMELAPTDLYRAAVFFDDPRSEPGPGSPGLTVGVPTDLLAVDLYGEVCAAGIVQACVRVAAWLSEGPDETRDYVRARSLLEEACERSDLHACGRLGRLTRAGRGGPRDPARAFELLRDACGGQDIVACTQAREMIERGEHSPPDPEVLESIANMECLGRGPARACAITADAHVRQGEIQSAARALRRVCRGRESDAREHCPRAARLSYPSDPSGAGFMWRMACNSTEAPDPESCAWAAHEILPLGEPSSRSERRSRAEDARRLASTACDAGIELGCVVLAEAEAFVRGRPPPRVLRRYDDACDDGVALACYLRGRVYFRSRRARDLAAARDRFARACDAEDGMALGCAELSEMLAEGRGGAVDAEGAADRLARTCAFGWRECHTLGERRRASGGADASPPP